MTRGRKPKPPELRVIQGDKRVRGLAAATPAPHAPGEPVMPDWTDEHQDLKAAKWLEVTDLLRDQGTLGREVGDVVRLYVEALIEAQVARRNVDEHGTIVPAPRTGVPMHNLYRAVARQAEATALKLAAELGLTPSSRGRVPGAGKATVNRFAKHGPGR